MWYGPRRTRDVGARRHASLEVWVQVVARALAMAFLAGPWRLDDLVARGSRALGQRHRFLRPLARRLLAQIADEGAIGVEGLAARIVGDEGFRRGYARAEPKPRARRWLIAAPAFVPPSWLGDLALPPFATTAELAESVGVEVDELERLARQDRRGDDPRRWHYRHRWVRKRNGAWRLIEAPKSRLKAVQRALLRLVVGRVPPHEAAHGFRRGRSAVTHAAQHAGRRIVVRMDLEAFFSSIGQARVEAIFAGLGYPEAVARLLARLGCVATPAAVLAERRAEDRAADHRPVAIAERWTQAHRLAAPHLPQGAPTSPALASLAAYGLDVRLTALARAFEATYTRYADDLVFSGGRHLDAAASDLVGLVAAAAIDERFRVQWRKTRVMRAGGRQEVCGVVVNRHPNLRRADLDQLEAILTNCVRHGPEGQNREGRSDFRAHLAGRVGWASMVNPRRAEKLRRLFGAIAWSDDAEIRAEAGA